MIKLYDYVLSANCYKVRLLLNMLDVEYEPVLVDFYPGREHKTENFRRTVNPLGHIPVLDDDGFVMRDAHAILVYLAAMYDTSGQWYPTSEPQRLGETAQWLAFAEGTTNTASAARLHVNMGYDFDIEQVRAGAHELFRVADEHLWFRERQGEQWFASGGHPTIADLALFPDIAMAEEGGVDLLDYPALRRWLDRFKQTPGFIVMPGVFLYGGSQ